VQHKQHMAVVLAQGDIVHLIQMLIDPGSQPRVPSVCSTGDTGLMLLKWPRLTSYTRVLIEQVDHICAHEVCGVHEVYEHSTKLYDLMQGCHTSHVGPKHSNVLMN
jgi:hypothetical protein